MKRKETWFAQDQSSGNSFFKIGKLLSTIRCHCSSMHNCLLTPICKKVPFSVSIQISKLTLPVTPSVH